MSTIPFSYGAGCRNRTHDLLITSQLLWPAELNRQVGGVGRQESNLTVFSRTTTLNQNRHIMEEQVGFEPTHALTRLAAFKAAPL